MENEKTNSKKLLRFFSIIIIIFVSSIVPREFQNDTFFNISIGRYIVQNGISSIDMKEHWAFTEGLSYTFSHWAFDIVVYLIYTAFNFTGIYIFTIVLSVLTFLALFYCLSKRNNNPVFALLITLFFSYYLKFCLTARSQIISFICFILEIYCIEQFIETNKKRYAVSLVALSIIIANFHSATWPLFIVLFMPYYGSAFLNLISSKNFFKLFIKRDKKKLEKLSETDSKYSYYKEDLEIYTRLLKKENEKKPYKIEFKQFYNIKNLSIILIIVILSGLLTPIHSTPYTYILKSMFGESNFEKVKSIAYIAEMQPLIPMNSVEFMLFMIGIIYLIAFTKSKIKIEHVFLFIGLLYMALESRRYVFLLVPLGCYIILDLLTTILNKDYKRGVNTLEDIFLKPVSVIICLVAVTSFSIYNFHKYAKQDFVNEELYPTKAIDYVLNNIDYKNSRIYTSYNFGSYLMLNNIPVFIDSRLDVYCSEFNDTDIFYDYVKVSSGEIYYEDIFTKYDFTHILLYDDEMLNVYLKHDPNYKLIYEDENFSLYER